MTATRPRRPRRLPLPAWPLHACTPGDAVAWLVAADRAYELGYDREATWARRVAKALEGGPRLVLIHRDYLLLPHGGRVVITDWCVPPGSTLGDHRHYEWWSLKTYWRRRWEVANAWTPSKIAAVPADWPAMAEYWSDVALAWFRRITWGVKVES